LAIAIRNGQKIFPMHPAGHSRDCLRIIGWRHLRARKFAPMCVRIVREAVSFPYIYTD
jgi:hypothetical protein